MNIVRRNGGKEPYYYFTVRLLNLHMQLHKYLYSAEIFWSINHQTILTVNDNNYLFILV